MRRIAYMFSNGLGVEQNLDLAAKYTDMANEADANTRG